VKKGLARDPKQLPPLHSGTVLSAEAQATVELLKVLPKAAAGRQGVAPGLIAACGKFLPIIVYFFLRLATDLE